jgi:hypothetical protein
MAVLHLRCVDERRRCHVDNPGLSLMEVRVSLVYIIDMYDVRERGRGTIAHNLNLAF